MNGGKTAALFALLCLIAAVLLRVGLPTEQKPVEQKPEKERPMPRLLADQAFRADLERSGRRGIAGITVVAPGSGLHGADVARAREMARLLGVSLPAEAMDETRVPYNATLDDVRLDLLARALADPETEVLWALRGGYGCSRLLEKLAAVPGLDRPKVFVGYSDMTFLHLFFQRRNWPTVHAAMFWELNGSSPQREDNLRRLALLLAGRQDELRYDGLEPYNEAARRAADPVEGAMTGGNLTCLAAACGTPWAVQSEGRILFIEDVKESGYKIDRMLTQLRLAGAFDGVRAVVLGSFSRGDEYTEYALKRFAADFSAPVFKTDMFGHGEKNYPLVFGVPAVIDGSEGGGAAFTLRIPVGDGTPFAAIR